MENKDIICENLGDKLDTEKAKTLKVSLNEKVEMLEIKKILLQTEQKHEVKVRKRDKLDS